MRFGPMESADVERLLRGEECEMITARSAGGGDWWLVAWISEALFAGHVPRVEAIYGSAEGEGAEYLLLVVADVDLAVVGESGFAMRVFPEPVDGDEGFGEGGHASDILDEELPLLFFRVDRDDG